MAENRNTCRENKRFPRYFGRKQTTVLRNNESGCGLEQKVPYTTNQTVQISNDVMPYMGTIFGYYVNIGRGI